MAHGDPQIVSGSSAAIEPVYFAASDLNPMRSPSDDLDAFVNSLWREKNPVPDGHSYWDCFSILNERSLLLQAEIARDCASRNTLGNLEQRIVGNFWASGMDVEKSGIRGLQQLQLELRRIDALDTTESIADYLRQAHGLGAEILFRLETQPDFSDPKMMLAFIVSQGLGLPDRDLYFDTTMAGFALLDAYKKHISQMLQLSGSHSADIEFLAANILEFERRIAHVSVSRRTLARDIAKCYNPVSLDAAEAISPTFSWQKFFASLGLQAPRFSLANPEFHAEIDVLLRTMPAQTWRAYLRFHVTNAAAPLLTENFFAAHDQFYAGVLRGRRSSEPRWKYVLKVLNTHVGDAMGSLYAIRHCRQIPLQRLHELFGELRDAMRARIEKLGWMSATTKHSALQKLANMRARIGHPHVSRDWSGLVTTCDSWYGNFVAARAFQRRRMCAQIDQPVDPNHWPLTAHTINARYDPQRNEIILPSGILQPPLFDPTADAALNYGGIGAVIAHEMTHAFDDQGSRFDAQGRFENWWADDDRARFEALANSVIEYFNQCRSSDGETVDGLLTLGENIADLGGLSIACDALCQSLARRGGVDPMHDGFTQLQRFFFSWATLWRQNMTPDERRLRRRTDPHAPGNIRTNIAAMNLAAYADAFDCRDEMAVRRDGVASTIGIW